MLTLLLGLLTIAAPLGAVDAPALAASARHPDAPGIRVWISSRDLFRRGERARVFYRTERDAFVTVLRVDTDGRVQVLFPRSAWDDNYAYGGTTYSINRVNRNETFVVDDDPGMGYIFAVASDEPFDYRGLLDGQNWDVRLASGGRVHGDPLQTLEEMVVQALPAGFTDFDTHLIPYYVERRYDYPRFVCYDCHTYMPYSYWDPYAHWCRRYTLVVWYDPYYYYPSYWYPTRYYGGTRVVYVNPGGSAPDRGRYVFKSRESSEPGIDYRDRRTTESADRRVGERFVRGTDVGGVGTIATPGRRLTEPARRRPVDVSAPAASEGLTPRDATSERRRAEAVPATRNPGMTFGEPPAARNGTADARRAPDRQDAGTAVGEAGRRVVEITNPPPASPGITPTEAPSGRRDPAFWRSAETRRQQPGTTERRAGGADAPRSEASGGRRAEAEPAPAQGSRGTAAPQSAPAAKPGSPAASGSRSGGSQPAARGGSQPSAGGGSQPGAAGGSQPSSRGSSGSSARPSGSSSGGSPPASPGLVRRRPS